mgnify:CR=1 FL=1
MTLTEFLHHIQNDAPVSFTQTIAVISDIIITSLPHFVTEILKMQRGKMKDHAKFLLLHIYINSPKNKHCSVLVIIIALTYWKIQAQVTIKIFANSCNMAGMALSLKTQTP